MTPADLVAILVLVLMFGYATHKIGELLYGFVRFFVVRGVAWWSERRLHQHVHDRIGRRRALHIVRK